MTSLSEQSSQHETGRPAGPPETAEPPEPARRTAGPSRLPAPLALLRPGQWPKNILVVPLPLLGADLAWGMTARTAVAVGAFVLASSLVYVVNDLADIERDRRHPVKRHRPLASGRIAPRTAVGLALLLAALLVPPLVAAGPGVAAPVLLYLGVNAAYSWRLKHLPLLDVFVVATGFVLRLLGGYGASGRPLSAWLVLTVLTLCLVLIVGKRRHELGVAGSGHRPALVGYSAHFLDLVLVLCSGLTVVGYLLYLRTESGYETGALLTAPLALFALFRYLQIVVVHAEGGNPVHTLLRDRAMLATAALWAALLLTFQLT
ncbi:UbiA prenyltransferase family protein [Kitasatospora sp. NPDC094019]|uniref:UbiA prenyltransferase family protein n=1 Tax=Kitasatospora sp. NPDC094019 TaxID=3364091 RepID=UPI00380D4B31